MLLPPIVVGILGVIPEQTMLQRPSGLVHLYGLRLTFGPNDILGLYGRTPIDLRPQSEEPGSNLAPQSETKAG